MERNRILNLSAWVFRILRGLVLILFVLILSGFIYWLFNPAALDSAIISTNGDDIKLRFVTGETNQGYPLSAIHWSMALFHTLKYSVVLLLLYFIFGRGLRVIAAMDHFETFRRENVQHFKMVGALFLWLALLDTIDFFWVGGKFWFNFELPVTNLVAALVAFLLAEIFREGNRLMEEQELTV